MAKFKTTLTTIQSQATRASSLVALKIPQHVNGQLEWEDVTYATFLADIEASARYWIEKLRAVPAPERSVVGLWLKGIAYDDYVHTLGLTRAGYVPQLISLRMTDPSVVYELLGKAKAVALIHDPSFASMLHSSPIPALPAGQVSHDPHQSEHISLASICEADDPEEVIMILHTSGSTSGVPKLVPVVARWVDTLLSKVSHIRNYMPTPDPQIITAIGSFMHMGSHMALWENIANGGIMVLPTAIPFAPEELVNIIKNCKLNKLAMFPPLMSAMFRAANKNPELLRLLQSLDALMYGGMGLEAGDIKWAHERGMRPVNVFGSTESGFAMVGRKSADDSYLEPFAESKFEFLPIDDGSDSEFSLLEWVIPPESPDCPHESLRAADGKFHSGDLFSEVEPGRYLSQGRADGWIKMETSLRCDTSAIEANALQTCGSDLIHAAVVVGARRPSPVLIVEPHDEAVPNGTNGDMPHPHHEQLKKDIFGRIEPFHKRRYQHERIDHPRFIVVVPKGSLPRTTTKGNIRRKEVEHHLKDQINAAFSSV